MIVARLLEELEQHQWADHDVFAIHLAVEEALVNAIKHGNHKDPSKSVQFTCRMSGDRIEIQITDEGDGFDPDAVPDPTDEENLEIPSGRGLMLMRCYMSSVEFNPRGNRVTMVKLRSDSPGEDDRDEEEEDD